MMNSKWLTLISQQVGFLEMFHSNLETIQNETCPSHHDMSKPRLDTRVTEVPQIYSFALQAGSHRTTILALGFLFSYVYALAGSCYGRIFGDLCLMRSIEFNK